MLTFSEQPSKGSRPEYAVFLSNGTPCGVLYMELDGYYVWLPSRPLIGYLDGTFLRLLADKIAELNASWDAEVRRELQASHDQSLSERVDHVTHALQRDGIDVIGVDASL
jgi:hypothetical protein